MDYFAVMNSGSYSGEGSYQHEVIVGDEDPSLSFATSPTWGHTLDEELLAVDYADALAGITGPENDEDNDSDSCNGPEDAIDGMSDCSTEIKENPFVIHQKGIENKRKRGIEEVNEAENEDYSRLLSGCKIIKTECNSSGYLEGILGISKNDDEDSSQSDSDERGSLDDVNVKRESRSTTRHDSGGSAANSDEENEARLFNTQKVTITLQPKTMVTSQDDKNNTRVKYQISNEEDEEDGEIHETKTLTKLAMKGSRKVNGYTKPRLSYAQLIAEALMGSEKRRLTLNDIYVKINARHPYYSLGGDRGNIMSPPNWQNAVRHNLTLNKAFVKVPRPANEGRGSFWSLAPDSEKDIFKRLLRQQNLSTISTTSTSRNIYNRISSSPTPITLSVPSSKPKQLCTVATQTYPASVHFDVSQSSLLSPSVSTPSPSPSPPLPLNKQYVTYQTSNRITKVPTPNIKVVRSMSGLKNEENSGNPSKLIPISSNKTSGLNQSSTKPTIIYVTIPKRSSSQKASS